MRIAITGASGLIGSHLTGVLAASGHEVVRLVRGAATEPDAAPWDTKTGGIDVERAGHPDAVLHLAGAGIAERRWSPDYKREILDSRVGPTSALARALAASRQPPRVLITASAVGYYGNRGDEALTETSPPGTGFLPDVCIAWERAAAPAREAGIRVAHLRTGIVLTPRGGALRKMLPAFGSGVGGRVGSGGQFMSWISLDDAVSAIVHVLDAALEGPVNVTAPEPVTNAVFSATLGHVLHRPARVPVPAFAIRTLFGEMGESLLLGGQRVLPRVLLDSGYAFRHSTLEAALRHVLGR